MAPDPTPPLRIVNSVAPIRVCDNGGWTDTWFAKHGRVFNVGVYPYVEVQIALYPRDSRPNRCILHAENFGQRYAVFPTNAHHEWIHHPLLEAAIDYVGVPDDCCVAISIYSEAPAGCSTGTSAAVSVALIGALDCLTPGRLTPLEVAYTAHRIETDILKQQFRLGLARISEVRDSLEQVPLRVSQTIEDRRGRLEAAAHGRARSDNFCTGDDSYQRRGFLAFARF